MDSSFETETDSVFYKHSVGKGVWKFCMCLKRRYLHTSPHSFTAQKTNIDIITAVEPQISDMVLTLPPFPKALLQISSVWVVTFSSVLDLTALRRYIKACRSKYAVKAKGLQ